MKIDMNLSHKDIPDRFYEAALMHFGVDKIWWNKLNKPFYQNRKPLEWKFGALRLMYHKHRGCCYAVKVVVDMFDPEQLARELLSVQPMNPDLFKNLLNDPLANALMNRFVVRQEYKKPL